MELHLRYMHVLADEMVVKVAEDALYVKKQEVCTDMDSKDVDVILTHLHMKGTKMQYKIMKSLILRLSQVSSC